MTTVTTAPWTTETEGRLAKLEKIVRDDPQFDDEDEEALRAVILAFQGLKMFGRFSKWIVYILAALAGAITAWNTIISQTKGYWEP